MKSKLLQVRVDSLSLDMLEYLKRINGYKSTSDTIRKTIEKEYRKEKDRIGHWIAEPNCYYRCSLCKSHYVSMCDTIEHHYCPNCGARME